MAAATLVGGAGLSLAQDQNLLQPPPTLENDTGSFGPLNQLDIPPPEEAPPVAEAPAPPAPAAPPVNAVANTVAELPPPPPPPPKRPRYTTVVLQTLDKVTAETLRFEAKVDEPVRYKDLVITIHACETQATDEPYAQTAAHMDVQYQPEVLGGRTPPGGAPGVPRLDVRGRAGAAPLRAPDLRLVGDRLQDDFSARCARRRARAGRGQPVEVGRPRQRLQQAAAIVGAADLLGPELGTGARS